MTFEFPDDWVVRKFDDTKAYQSLSGHGLKGVDFIAIAPAGMLWFVEVKNYRPRQKKDREYRAKRRIPRELAEHLAQKFNDTQRLLRIVNKSLTAKWWFNIWKRFRFVWPDTNSMYWFWNEAYDRIQNPEQVNYVVWLETPERNDDYDMAVRRELEVLLPGCGCVYVVENERNTDVPIAGS